MLTNFIFSHKHFLLLVVHCERVVCVKNNMMRSYLQQLLFSPEFGVVSVVELCVNQEHSFFWVKLRSRRLKYCGSVKISCKNRVGVIENCSDLRSLAILQNLESAATNLQI